MAAGPGQFAPDRQRVAPAGRPGHALSGVRVRHAWRMTTLAILLNQTYRTLKFRRSYVPRGR